METVKNEKKDLKMKTIREAFTSEQKCDRIAALKACMGRSDIPINLIEAALSDPDGDIRRNAERVCGSIVITPGKVWRGIYNSRPEIVLATIRSVRGRGELTLDFVIHCLKNNDDRVKLAIAKACTDVEVPAETVFEWLNSHEYYRQLAAAYSCAKNPAVATRFLGIMLDARNNDVRRVALEVAATIPHPPHYSTITPPQKVYKKCLGDVIVVAKIPDNAIVYGELSGPCRANKAEIVGIKGSFYGESVGISVYDLTTTYRVGDKIEFNDDEFNKSKTPYSGPGFYFFCDETLAKIYNL